VAVGTQEAQVFGAVVVVQAVDVVDLKDERLAIPLGTKATLLAFLDTTKVGQGPPDALD
jgi:hypothetical protein